MNATLIFHSNNLTCFSLSDVQHHCDLPRWESSPAGAGLHPRQQDPLPHPTRHVKECSHVKEHEEQEPGIRRRKGQGSHSQSSRCVAVPTVVCLLLTEMDVLSKPSATHCPVFGTLPSIVRPCEQCI